ncbi:MAG: dodecin [Acidimicrobiales bacterium]
MSDVQTHWIDADEFVDGLTCPTYRLAEIVGASPNGVDEAIANGLAKARATLHGLAWFQVDEIRGTVRDGRRSQTQVCTRVGFRVDE